MAGPQIIVEYTANTSGLQKGFGQAEKSSSGLGSSLKSVGKVGAVAAGAAGVGALVATLQIGIGEFSETQKVAAQTNAVLKSTGGAANVSSQHVSALAEALMKKSGVDDEAIASGENLLLTFTNVRNEVGRGNDIFDQATTAALDMSVALGTDMKTSAMQLGKALNDPVAGMDKLKKSGVTFTDAQKKMAKQMVASGDTMGAQKLILKELNKEFGGSAEAIGKTLPGQIEIVKQSFNNLAGDLVAKLVPVLTQVIEFVKANWPAISAVIKTAWEGSIKPVLAAFGDLVVSVVGLIRDNWGTIGPIVKQVGTVFKDMAAVVRDALQLIAALLRGDWSAAWREFKELVGSVVDAIKSRVELALMPLKLILGALWTAIKTAAETAWNLIKTTIGAIVAAIKTDIVDTWNDIKSVVTTVATAIRTALVTAFNAIKFAGEAVADFFRGAWSAAVNAAKGVVGGLDGALDALRGAFDTAKTAAKNVVTFFTGVLAGAVNTAKDALGGLSGVLGTIAGAFDTAAGAVQGLIDAIGRIPSKISLPSLPSLPGWVPGVGGNMAAPMLAAGPSLLAAPQAAAQASPSRLSSGPINVRVFIGDTELKGIVRSEVRDSSNGLARTILAGAR